MKYINVSNVKEYEKLSFSERHFLGFWYRLPMYYEINQDETFEEYWKRKYPFQFFIRNTIENILISIEVIKDKIIDNTWRKLVPRNSWARKTIPHTYCDKPELIKEFLFASIVDFVENENIDLTDWEANETMSEVKNTIDEIYKFVKQTFPYKEARIEKLRSALYAEKSFEQLLGDPDYDKDSFDRLKNLETELDTEIQQKLIQIIEIREYLWT